MAIQHAILSADDGTDPMALARDPGPASLSKNFASRGFRVAGRDESRGAEASEGAGS